MKTFIWIEKNRKSTKFGYKFDVHVFRVVNNVPELIGWKEDINSGSMKGGASEALSVLIDKGIVPEKYVKKTSGYFYSTELAKHNIRFIGV
jgi:hypothetical protein